MAYDKNNKGEAMGWDDIIEDEGGEFVIIPAGDYMFTVESFQRKRFGGSERMCACNQIALKLRIDCPEGVVIEDNLFLNRKVEWKVSQFLKAIGWKKPGEPVRPNWDALPGTRGRCKVKVDKWKGRDGNEMESNKIDKYYPAENPSGAPAPAPVPAPAYQQPTPAPQQYQQTAVGGWSSTGGQAGNWNTGNASGGWNAGKF